jgi:carbon-monoxide dehydrogenase medium subunit
VRPPFAYHRPATLEEACRLLAAEPRARVLAGGTDLLVHLRQGQRGLRPLAVVNIKRLRELRGIDADPEALRIGALTTLAELIDHPVIRTDYPVLPFAARYMGSPAIRHLATVGGNLANASPAADLPPVFLVLDAEVGIAGAREATRLPLGDLFRGPGQTALRPGELLAWIAVPRRRTEAHGWTIRYERLDVRRAMDIAMVGVALALRREGERVLEARVALGAVAPTPIRVPAAEAALVAGGLDEAAIAAAAELAMAAARPIDDHRASADYRRDMVGALVQRGLLAMRAPAS